ncbi:MAG: hypothetical protein QNK03_15875 [Myxococcota bacterium]|nr:hypothetical protein [Myxococcota bacterium]
MEPVALVPWIALGIALFAAAPRVRPRIVGAVLLVAGLSVFAVRLHHAGPYPFPGVIDLASGCAALLAGGLLARAPRQRRSQPGLPRTTRCLLGLSPVLFLLALVSMGHEAEEVVVLRTNDGAGATRETRLWVVDHQGSPWVVTGRGSPHDAALAADPRVEIFRRGEAHCWLAERHVDRETLETLLRRRSELYLAQRIAIGTGMWRHFEERDDLDEIAVAIRFEPCPQP